MKLFYKDQHLYLNNNMEKINLFNFAKNKKTPFYFYDFNSIKERFFLLKKSLKVKNSIHYSIKANSNLRILKFIRKLGGKIDIVSKGEMSIALKAGFKGNDMVFSGVGKTHEEIEFAIENNIKQINVESPHELLRIAEIAKKKKKKAIPVAFRLNPDVSPNTHPFITTGFRENKFGMDRGFLPELKEIIKKNKEYLFLKGLAMHIGSQLLHVDAIQEAILKIISVYKELSSEGYQIKNIDIGGGLGIFYQNNDDKDDFNLMRDYVKIINNSFKGLEKNNIEVIIEPGRFLVARSGFLITKVQYIKNTEFKNFIITDTGMHHLIRPALYQGYHRIFNLKLNNKASEFLYDIVGPICESTDFLGKDRLLKEVNIFDLLLIADVGAYGFSMASNYNSHALPKEYFK